MEIKTRWAQDKNGKVIPFATVSLFYEGTTDLVTGLETKDGGPLSNPFQSDVNGKVVFAAPDGQYDIKFSSGPRESTASIQFLDVSGALQVVENIDALRSITGNSGRYYILAKFHTSNGDGGGGSFYWESGAAPGTYVDNGGTVIVPTGGDGSAAWVRDYDGEVNVRWFGAKGDGVSDDTAAVQAALNTGNAAFPKGTYPCSQLSAPNAFSMLPGSVIKYIGPDGDAPLTISGSDLEIPNITLDANHKYIFGLTIAGPRVKIGKVLMGNCVAPVDSGTVYGVRILSDDCTISEIETYGFANTGNVNTSMPQTVGILGTVDGTVIGRAIFKGGGAGVVTGGSTGKTTIHDLLCEGITDNGIYQLGGYLSLGNMDYYGSEEAAVFKGDAAVGSVNVYGAATSGLGFDSCGDVTVEHLHVEQDADGNSAGNLFRTRSENVASGRITIGRITGNISPHSVWGVNNGTVEYLSVLGGDVRVHYDASIFTNLNGSFDLQACSGFNIKNLRVHIVDTNNVLTGSTQFRMVAPTTNLASQSFLSGLEVIITQSDGVTLSSGAFYGVNFAQNLIHVKGQIWMANIGPYVREATAYGGTSETINQAPTGGTWRIGQDFALANATAAPFRVRCTLAGSPGTWVSY